VRHQTKRHHRAAQSRKKKPLEPVYDEKKSMFYAFFTRLAAGKEEAEEEPEDRTTKKLSWGKRSREESKGDDVSRKLQKSGVYRIRDGNTYAKNDSEGPRFTSPVTYSFWSGAKYCLLLSLFLWWFPIVGNIIAGYIGGRRAGGPWRGVLACLLPVIVLMILQYGYDHNLLPAFIVFIIQIPEMVGRMMVADLPAAAPYYTASVVYVTGFAGYLGGLLTLKMNLYVVTIVFGYVGGAVAELRQADYAAGSSSSDSSSSSNSNVVVNVHGGGRGAEEEDGFSPSRKSGGSLPDYSPPPAHRPLPPLSVAALSVGGPNWRRRRLRGELQAERDARIAARRKEVRDGYFRVEQPGGEGRPVPTPLAARRQERARREDDAAEETVPASYLRKHTPVQRPRAVARPARDRVKQLEDEGEEVETKRSASRHPVHNAPHSRPHHEAETKALPARAVRKVPKLERGEEPAHGRGGPATVAHLQRASPTHSAAERAAHLVREKRIHRGPSGDDEEDDEGERRDRVEESPADEDVPDKRQDEIQKLVQRALKGTGPANFQVKKEAEHNWEVL
jgi:hypothetical protein